MPNDYGIRTIGTIHTHNNLVCYLSPQDIYAFGISDHPFIAIICGEDKFNFFNKKDLLKKTEIDFKEFMNTYSLNKEEAIQRAKEATEGVIESIRWLEIIDGVLLVMDSTLHPFTQVNVTIIGNLEARSLPVLIAANKIDMDDSSPATLKTAFPQHPVIPISALTGYNAENLYSTMVTHFKKKRRKHKR